MARKRSERTRKNVISVMDVEAASGQPTRWSGLGKGSRWAVIGVVLFLGIGALGAGLKYLDDTAKTDKKIAARERSTLSSLNPFASAPPPSPTPQLSKEYLYAGQRLLAVEDKYATADPPTDLAVWRPSNGGWYVLGGPGSQQTIHTGWGTIGDEPVEGDYS